MPASSYARGHARGSIAVAQAKAFAGEVAVEVGSDLFALSGASAADERHDLSRRWRNARTHASHDPGDWKYQHAGNFALNGTVPPNHAQRESDTTGVTPATPVALTSPSTSGWMVSGW